MSLMKIHLNSNQIQKLKKNHNKNINIINFSKTYPLTRFDFVNDSIVLTGTSDNSWTYISLDNENDMDWVIKKLREENKHIVIFDKSVLDYYESNYEIEWKLSCEKYVYESDRILKLEDVYELTEDDAYYIQENNSYNSFTDIEYIKFRIQNGIGIGIKKHNKLVAWVLTHDDGAIGFMHVLEDYRNKGYALQLTNEIVRRLLSVDDLPFVHIEKNNEKSIKLAEKSGFKYVGDIHWIKIKQKKTGFHIDKK